MRTIEELKNHPHREEIIQMLRTSGNEELQYIGTIS